MPASVPQVVAEWMRPFTLCFTAAVWRHVLVLVAGTLLVPGRRTVTASGLRWLCVMLLAPVPWAGCIWGLPFLTVLAPSEHWSREHGRRHKRLTDWARQVLLQTARWLPGRRGIAVADSSFSAIELLRDVGRHLCMISRLRLRAGLYEPPPRRTPGTLGRPRVKGARLPSLADRLKDPTTSWTRVSIEGWCGRTERPLHIPSGTALSHHPAA